MYPGGISGNGNGSTRLTLDEIQGFFASEHARAGGQQTGQRAVGSNDGHGADIVLCRGAGARINDVSVAAAI